MQQTITKYFLQITAETKTSSSSWTAEGRAPSQCGLVELEDETINETETRKVFKTRIRSSKQILQDQEQDQNQT